MHDAEETIEATMQGWILPPPTEPTKSREAFARERTAKVQELISQGLLKSTRITAAMLKVSREDFLPRLYRDYAYCEVPLPLPGAQATISCPHSYPLFYEPLGLEQGQRVLEVGLGSGYGTALAREIVGTAGVVVAVEIDPLTFAFATRNLERAGYTDIVLVQGDGGQGYVEKSPYDRIVVTAACRAIPTPLIEQLHLGGKLIAPVFDHDTQLLVLLTKSPQGLQRQVLCEVLYVPLRGKYGAATHDSSEST